MGRGSKNHRFTAIALAVGVGVPTVVAVAWRELKKMRLKWLTPRGKLVHALNMISERVTDRLSLLFGHGASILAKRSHSDLFEFLLQRGVGFEGLRGEEGLKWCEEGPVREGEVQNKKRESLLEISFPVLLFFDLSAKEL
jgi:hypothetical protein